MDSNETVLMCDEASVTNAPLCIHQSPQIINQLDGPVNSEKGKYLLLEITWDDYVLY